MNAIEKVAHHRLTVLELAQALGSVSEACKRKGMTRTMFYEYKKRFTEQGMEGLKTCHRSLNPILLLPLLIWLNELKQLPWSIPRGVAIDLKLC